MKAVIVVPVILAVLYRAWSHKSLTPAGIVAAGFTAVAHAVHPWTLSFALLLIFFQAGTRVTKVKHDVKAKLTMQSSGSSGGEGARTHIQVLANSVVASVLTLLHAYQLRQRAQVSPNQTESSCYTWGADPLVVGIVANYAAVAADTFSSELGILSKTRPRLITSLNLRQVPPGTNGGVTVWGLISGLLGSLMIATAAVVLIPFCPGNSAADGVWGLSPSGVNARLKFAGAITIWGVLGSILDSLLGGWLQPSVVDTRTGRIVEGEGGSKVIVTPSSPNTVHPTKREGAAGRRSGADDTINKNVDVAKQLTGEEPSRKVESGSLGILDNNQVNFLMALIISVGAMASV